MPEIEYIYDENPLPDELESEKWDNYYDDIKSGLM
jgi:hypothetical protein